MDKLILDRRGRLLKTPAFLAVVGERERSLGRLALFVALGSLLAILASIVAIAGVLAVAGAVMSGEGQSFPEALQTLMAAERPDRSLLSYTYEFSAIGLSLFAAALALIALAAKLYRRPMRSFITAAPRFRWRQMLLGVAVAAPIIGLALLVELAFSDTPLEPPILNGQGLTDAAGYITVAVGFLFMAALAEEMIFRGWLLQQTAAFSRNIVVLLAVNGVLFAAIHFDPDPGAFAVRAAMGAGWAWIALRLGGLEFATGAHLANNLAVTLLVEPLKLVPPSGEPTDYRSVLLQLAMVLVTIVVVERLAGRNKLEKRALRG